MMGYLKDKLTDHFNKLLLAFLFIGVIVVVVHLMNKSDAGGDDAAFILWATNTASLIMGKLLGMMPQDKPEVPANTSTETKVITTTKAPIEMPDPNVKEKI
jgi:hypothetical protein